MRAAVCPLVSYSWQRTLSPVYLGKKCTAVYSGRSTTVSRYVNTEEYTMSAETRKVMQDRGSDQRRWDESRQRTTTGRLMLGVLGVLRYRN